MKLRMGLKLRLSTLERAVKAKAETGAKKLQKVLRMTRIGKNLAVISNYTNSNLICRSLDTQYQHPPICHASVELSEELVVVC